MRFPWTRRAEERAAQAQAGAEAAEEQLAAVRAQWPVARQTAGESRRRGDHISAAVAALLRGSQRG